MYKATPAPLLLACKHSVWLFSLQGWQQLLALVTIHCKSYQTEGLQKRR
jgi:hypothetical protein